MLVGQLNTRTIDCASPNLFSCPLATSILHYVWFKTSCFILVTSEQPAEVYFAESILISSSNITKYGDIYRNKTHTCCDSSTVVSVAKYMS